ncbi:MAG: hypothetical protein ACRCTZ_05755 [Sarcina sp.]
MLKDKFELDNGYNTEIERIEKEIEEILSPTDIKTKVENEKKRADLKKELEIYKGLKKDNLEQIGQVIESETQKANTEILMKYNAVNRAAEKKANDLINKVYDKIQELQAEREKEINGIDRTELNFLLNKYQELKGKAFFTHVQTVPNLQTIRQLEEIRKRINWK